MTGTSPGPDPGAFAALLCDWCLEVAPDDRVLVNSTTLAEPLAVALHNAILDRDAWPFIWLTPSGLSGEFYRHAGSRHLDGPSPTELSLFGAVTSFLRIGAPANVNELAGIDPKLISRAAVGRAQLSEMMRAVRWCTTLMPTAAMAKQAGMGEQQYADFLDRALFLDRTDPIAAWRELSASQDALIARLSPAREIRIEAEGTDLTLAVEGRTWINSNGKRNMPSGEVFTGPLERSANGTIRFSIPTGPRGVTVTGVELSFRDGEVVQSRAQQGADYLEAALATDAGARVLGEIGIGTNVGIDHATGQILLDEKMAGTVHLALGRSYPETGGTNASALHWDLICDLRDGGRLTADGEPVVEHGSIAL